DGQKSTKKTTKKAEILLQSNQITKNILTIQTMVNDEEEYKAIKEQLLVLRQAWDELQQIIS
ncbi:MAG: hypothetical protein ACKPKO_05430, partial [Candidatus Fonsibacter sp.]